MLEAKKQPVIICDVNVKVAILQKKMFPGEMAVMLSVKLLVLLLNEAILRVVAPKSLHCD